MWSQINKRLQTTFHQKFTNRPTSPLRRDMMRRARNQEIPMIVAIVTFQLSQPTTLTEITKTFQGTAPKYQSVPGLLQKYYYLSEDGRRAGGIYVWAEREDADRLYTPEWKTFVLGKYGTPPEIEYLNSPVMVDNRSGAITVAA